MDAFFLSASEIAIRLLHIRKEFLWFCGGLVSFCFLVFNPWPLVWWSGSPAEEEELRTCKSFVCAAQEKKALLLYTASSPCKWIPVQYGNKFLQKKNIPYVPVKKSLALTKDAFGFAVCFACAQPEGRQLHPSFHYCQDGIFHHYTSIYDPKTNNP